MSSSATLRKHACSIWGSGVEAVGSDALIAQNVIVDDTRLHLVKQSIELSQFDRICVVGGGKGVAGMAAALETALRPVVDAGKSLTGCVNVPDDCVLPTEFIDIHPARPAGRNEPTTQAVAGTQRMMQMVRELGPRDVCIVLLSGGGSALLPAPVPGISLDDKLSVTRMLSSEGADIHQLNTVRKQLSRIKGGGLAKECRAGALVTLVISDVLGDPLDVIASGPTVPDTSTPADALSLLESFTPGPDSVPDSVWNVLQKRAADVGQRNLPDHPQSDVFVLGNNQTALQACAAKAKSLGYETEILPTDLREPTAETVAQRLIDSAVKKMQDSPSGNMCLLSGGEPVVKLAPLPERGRGGRNQQLVLAALQALSTTGESHNITLLSGGTDGEDGPTDAAGALIWPDLISSAAAIGLPLNTYLERNDAYGLLDSLGALLKTGPTQTNVCDIRVILITRLTGV